MAVLIDYLPEFERRAKVLAKRYKSFPSDYQLLLDELEANPFGGTPLGHGVYKVRMTIAAKGRGKSGGARVITYNAMKEGDDIAITLMTIYDKSDISNVTDAYIKSLLAELIGT